VRRLCLFENELLIEVFALISFLLIPKLIRLLIYFPPADMRDLAVIIIFNVVVVILCEIDFHMLLGRIL
jgi:hypothetical protein